MAWILVGAVLFPQEGDQDSLEQGKKALQSREFARAEALFLQQVERHPLEPLGHFYLGYALAAQHRFSDAADAYQRAVDLGLKQFKAYYQLGYAAHRAGKHDVAERALLEALALEPSHADALYYLGVSRLERREFPAAIAAFTTLLERESRWTDLARFQRGVARLGQGDTAAGREDLRWVESHAAEAPLRERARRILQEEPAPEPDAPAAAPAGAKRWSLLWYEKLAFDSNVLRLPATSLTRATQEDDASLTTLLTLNGDLLEQGRLSGRLTLFDVSFNELSEFSLTALMGSLEGSSPLTPTERVVASAHAEAYFLDRDSLFRRFGLKGGVDMDLSETATLKARAAGWRKDFWDGLFADLESLEWGADLRLDARQLLPWMDGRMTYELLVEDAEADDRSYIQHHVQGRLTIRPDGPIRMEIDAGVRFRSYEEEDRVFAKRRIDTRARGRGLISYHVSSRWGLFLEIDAEQNESSLNDFDYRRWSIGLGTMLSL
ncbi:MAG: tetratricopeptide repeat protein [Planctomycetes bacterium]|nr:tetratricopeptide repeat protein [Planctomycetota bacterium]